MAKATPATASLDRLGIAFRLHSYDYDPEAPRIGLQAAESLGIAPARMFKTLMVQLESAKGPQVACALIPADAEMSLKKLAASAGARSAAMLKPDVAERHSGYHVGGISPLGQRKRTPAYVDASLRDHESVFVNGGQRGLQIEISPELLIKALEAITADLIAR